MTTPTSDQLARLPKWARDHIRRLERQAASATRRASIGWQDERTDACVQRTLFDAHPFRQEYRPIGRRTVLFGEVEVSLRNGLCHVTTTGSQHLVVHPHCSNVVNIEAVKP